MNKTLYVRSEDAHLWEKAREYTGDRLSAWIIEQLRKFVKEKEAQAQGFQRIVLSYTKGSSPRAKAFIGRWIVSPELPHVRSESTGLAGYALALTTKGNVAVFRFCGEKSGSGHYPDGELQIFRSFDEAAASCPPRLIARAMERAGVAVEELDV